MICAAKANLRPIPMRRMCILALFEKG